MRSRPWLVCHFEKASEFWAISANQLGNSMWEMYIDMSDSLAALPSAVAGLNSLNHTFVAQVPRNRVSFMTGCVKPEKSYMYDTQGIMHARKQISPPLPSPFHHPFLQRKSESVS